MRRRDRDYVQLQALKVVLEFIAEIQGDGREGRRVRSSRCKKVGFDQDLLLGQILEFKVTGQSWAAPKRRISTAAALLETRLPCSGML